MKITLVRKIRWYREKSMRNIADYEQHYMEHPFERYIEKYRRKVVKKTVEQYCEREDSILEIGCGVKPLFCDFEDQYFFTVIEPADSCYQNAKNMAESYPNVECFQGCCEDIAESMKTKKFRMIVCASLLHEVEDPHLLLKSIRLMCNENTIVHINVPNARSIHRLLATEMGLTHDIYQLSDTNKIFQQHNVFDIDLLKQLVNEEGYKVLDEGSYFIKPFTHQQMQKCMDYEILDTQILDGLDRLCKSELSAFGAEIYLNMQVK